MINKCSICGLNKRIATSKNGNICFNCYLKINKEICSICGNLRSVNIRKNNKPICQECNRKKDFCSICKKYKIIKKKIGDNKICGSCRSKINLEVCIFCNTLSQVVKRIGIFPVCLKCYKNMTKEECSICKSIKSVKARDNGLAVCESCHKKKKVGICFICNNKKPLNNIINSKKVCSNCYHKNNMKICTICLKLKQIVKNKNGILFCNNCYNKERLLNDINFLIKCRIRKRFRQELNKNKYSKKIQIYKDLYIDFKSILNYIGDCPGNISEYHIDHIFPLSIFDLSNPIDFQIACIPENHQWLLANDNLKKGAYFDKIKFKEFKKFIINKYNIK